jgi:hypothetical protein
MQVKMLFTLSLLIGFCGTAGVYASPVYFLVAETPGAEVHLDSYVLPLNAPEDIAHARDLIVKGPGIGNTIVVAKIAAGADGINRDYRAPDAPMWSWHVSEFGGFHDITAEILDGWPSFVESDVQGWIADTGGVVGFWSYTIVEELENLSIPAPGTLLLLLSGLGGLALLRECRAASLKVGAPPSAKISRHFSGWRKQWICPPNKCGENKTAVSDDD